MALGTWSIDPSHSAIAFAVRHMVVSKTRGRFTKWSGQLRFDQENPVVSSVEVTIDPASIDTADGQRDAHLRSADFLDVEKFPTASFRSTKVEEPDSGRYRITGDLTVHGVTKSVILDVTYEGSGQRDRRRAADPECERVPCAEIRDAARHAGQHRQPETAVGVRTLSTVFQPVRCRFPWKVS